ncbi:MAG: hypothetical protein ACK526_21180 [Planctomyces sp.]|jgi:hypothetical protein
MPHATTVFLTSDVMILFIGEYGRSLSRSAMFRYAGSWNAQAIESVCSDGSVSGVSEIIGLSAAAAD